MTMFEIGIFTKIGIYSSFNGQCIQLIIVDLYSNLDKKPGRDETWRHGERFASGGPGFFGGAVATHCSICGGQLP